MVVVQQQITAIEQMKDQTRDKREQRTKGKKFMHKRDNIGLKTNTGDL